MVGCGISPKPEPPAGLDIGRIGTNPPSLGLDEPIEGGPGSATPPGAVVRAFNLDNDLPPADGIVQQDGSFEIDLVLELGDEVRLQVISSTGRSAPVDIVVAAENEPVLPAVRPLSSCLILEPPLELDTASSQLVLVQNRCAGEVRISQIFTRSQLDGFTVAPESQIPHDLSAGADLPVTVEFVAPTGSQEEIFFVVADSPELDRRPITTYPSEP